MTTVPHLEAAIPLRDDPAFREAAGRVEQIETELRRIETETAKLDAAAQLPGGLTQAQALADATRALDGSDVPQASERRAALAKRAGLMRRALPDAAADRDRLARIASAAYMLGQAPRVATAYERLLRGFDEVLAASDLFDAVRRDAAALGFDIEAGGIPAGADLRVREWAQHWCGELRKELPALRVTISRAG